MSKIIFVVNENVVFKIVYGEIIIVFWFDVVLKIVENFKKFVCEGFYDGIVFYCIIKGFMI